jgi:ATP-dependent 26S proteasome regulatory subunit
MKKVGFAEAVEQYARAGYPGLYVTSWEEDRVMRDLRETAKKTNRRLFYWKLTTGWMEWTDQDHSVVHKESAGNPLVAIRTICPPSSESIFPSARVEGGKAVGGSILALLDFHHYLGDHQILRSLKDVLRQVKGELRVLVFVSPCAPRNGFPAEIEKEVTCIEHALPTEQDLGVTLDEICATNKVQVDADARRDLVRAARGLTSAEAENAYAVSLVRQNKAGFTPADIYTEKAQSVKKSGVLELHEAHAGFGDIGGLALLKAWLRRRKGAFSEDAQAYGLPAPRGLMLVGIQGGGKSLCAKAVAQEWQVPLLRFDVGRAFNSLQGRTEENVRNAIAVAEAVAPCVLWIDEVEKGMSGVKSSGQTDSGTAARVFGTILTWLQEKTSQVFVVATSNDISALPPEFVRKGRFDEIFFVDLPTDSERVEIAKIHIAKRNRKPENFDLDAISKATDGHSGGEIEAGVIDALYAAYEDGRREITTDDIVSAVKASKPLSITAVEAISRLREWAKDRARPAASPVESVKRDRLVADN